MRITKIDISGFRGFASNQTFDLDADAIIIVGANGRGKTSLFDAILWALTGTIPRLGEKSAVVVSKYSESGEAYVTLTLASANGDTYTISRATDGEIQHLRLEINNEPVTESQASAKLFEKIWPEALLATNGDNALTTALTRSVYLQQDLVTQFIEEDQNQDRFKSVSELVGIGRVTELQKVLESNKNAWARATTSLENDLEDARLRFHNLKSQLETFTRTSAQDTSEIDTIWQDWWQKIQRFGVKVSAIPPSISVEARSSVDEVMNQLEAIRRSFERRLLAITALIADIQLKGSEVPPDLSELRTKLSNIEAILTKTRDSLAKAKLSAAEERQHQIELHESQDELKALAQLALRHLNTDCPVCGQKYDKTRTRQRLENIIGLQVDLSRVDIENNKVNELANEVKVLEQERTTVETKLRETEDKLRYIQLWNIERDNRLKELNIAVSSEGEHYSTLIKIKTDLEQSVTTITKAQNDGEKIALLLASVSAIGRKIEVSNELQKAEAEVKNLEKTVNEREATANLSAQILNGLRDAGYFIVERRLNQVETLLQSIYATIDPHPAFRTVRFLTNLYRGHGLLDTQINDSVRRVFSNSPQTILSSSQMNALAVAVFLSFNLGVKSLPIHAAILDDPLQSLDDVNLLGVIDLLRRVKDKRQLFVSTHDARFGHLLELKLRPIHNQKTIIIELTGWDRRGPSIAIREVKVDRNPLKILV